MQVPAYRVLGVLVPGRKVYKIKRARVLEAEDEMVVDDGSFAIGEACSCDGCSTLVVISFQCFWCWLVATRGPIRTPNLLVSDCSGLRLEYFVHASVFEGPPEELLSGSVGIVAQ